MSDLYQRFYTYNPVGAYDVTIGTESDNVVTIGVQAMDFGDVNLEETTVFTLIVCTNTTGTPTTDTLVASANHGLILGDLTGALAKQNKLLCATDDTGYFECTITKSGTVTYYLLIAGPTGLYDTYGPVVFS